MDDRTTNAVMTQLHAMACDRYEIGVRDAQRGTMILREWSANEVGHAIPWLKLMNAHDHDVYVRPLGSVGLILTDDLTRAGIEQMTHDGLTPAVVVETSPGNLQAWLRVSAELIAQELATAAARIIAERYHGDPRAADWRHFGRLAGFTNRKRKHQRDGRQPYVLLRAAGGLRAENGAQLLQEAKARLQAASVAQHEPRPFPPVDIAGQAPGQAYRAIAARITAHYRTPTDYSRLDWVVCKQLACADPSVDQAYLEAALLGASPAINERKLGNTHDYARRTAEKVLRDPEVVAARKHLASKELGSMTSPPSKSLQ